MTKRLEFVLDKSKVLNSNKKLHRMVHGNIVKHLRTVAFEKGEELNTAEENLFDKFKISVTVCPPTRRHIDPANLWPTLKPLIDGLTDAKWWEDDDFKHLLEISFRYGGISGQKDTFRIIMEIEEIPEEDLTNYIMVTEHVTL